MKDVYIVQCLMETDLYKLLKTQVSIDILYICEKTIKREKENGIDLMKCPNKKILIFRLLVMITYVIFCTKYCGG